jgi:ribonuclease D
LQPPILVETDAALRECVERLRGVRELALDTESNTLYAYREKLCLLQISTADEDWIVDPLAVADLAPLAPIFADAAVLKVLHDAEFDLLTLRRAHPFELRAIFDTKAAAAALGYTQVGLAPLLRQFHGVDLDKRFQRSDWGRRPLTAGQLDYARRDTHWLLPLAAHLRARLFEAQEICMLEFGAECRRLESLVSQPRRFDPEEFASLRGAERLDPHARRVLRELFVMRHELAEQLDLPAFKVLGNDMLIAIARRKPQAVEQLADLPPLSPKLAHRWGPPILAAVRRALARGPLGRSAPPGETDDLGKAGRARYLSLRAWRKQVAAERPTDPALVLPRRTMLELARLDPPPRTLDELEASGLLELWRVRHYGEALLALLQGR